MRRLGLLAVVSVVALFVPAVASAHDEGEDGTSRTVYTGTDCGGRYHSPYTGHDWLDCYAHDDQIVVKVTWDHVTYFEVWRYYAHIVDGQYSHHTWRHAYTFR